MALYTSGTAAAILRPEDVGALVVQPVIAQSVAAQVATIVNTGSHDYRIPIVTDDVDAGWFAEGAEITPSDLTMDEEVVVPKKVAGLTIISRELAADTTPEAQQVVGESIARDIARRVDVAFFGNTTTNGPSGLLSLSGVQTVDTTGTIANTDPFAEAISKAETVGATVNTFVTHPDTALVLAKVKKATGSNEPLMNTDPTNAARRSVLGVPLLTTTAVAAGTIWAIPRSRVYLVIRENTTLEVDRSAYFSSDRIGVKAVMRVGFGFPHEAALVRMYDVTP
jgi:HK97 family phage major capsid protein